MSTRNRPRPATTGTGAPEVERITIYGDFNCPWSYLAFRRAELLATGGVDVDWRSVEHRAQLPHGRSASAPEAGLRKELDRVTGRLLPEEELPHAVPSFLPRTAAAVAAYAEGYAAGVAAPVARVLFESYWIRGIDVGDVYTLRTLLIDQLRDSDSPSRAVREWGAPVAVTGAPMSAEAYQLINDWSAHWQRIARNTVPVLQLPAAAEPILGVAAVDWLGERISERGLALDQPVVPARHCWREELPDPGWASAEGGRWHGRFQQCSAPG